MKLIWGFTILILICWLRPAMAADVDVCIRCIGSSSVGGPCYAGKGGPRYAGLGGPCYAGKGGPKYAGVGGPLYAGKGGLRYAGVGGPRYAGKGGPCYAGFGGPCFQTRGVISASCPDICTS